MEIFNVLVLFVAIPLDLEAPKNMYAKSRPYLYAFLFILCCFASESTSPNECFAVVKRALIVQDSESDELSEEESKSIKIADRFFSILEKSPRRGTALERVYGHHVEFGTLATFLQGLRDRVTKQPEDGTGWMLLGMFEAHRGQDAEAVDAFLQAEKFRPEDALPSYYLGQSQLLIGQPEKAVEAFERAIDRKPRRPDMLEVFRQLGRVHQRAQRTEEALDVWDRLEKLFPDDARVQEQIAITMVEEGEYKLALPRYEKLATMIKDDYRRVTFKIEAAELKIRLNNRTEGISDLEQLLADLNPTGWLFRDVRRRIEDIFLRSGDQDGLVNYYQNWIDKNPEDIGAIARLARFLASSARVEEAGQWMEKALKLAPKRTDLRKSFIDQLVNDQRYADASKQYAELVKSAPGNPDFLRDWGKLVMKDRSVEKDKRRQQAVKIWSRIVEARPDDALTQAQVADLYRQSGLESEAVELYQKAIELAPGEPQYREYLGEYFHILKRPDEALEIWESIAEGKRKTADNVARLAEVYNSFGYLPQAVEKIAAACELDPKEFTLQLKAAQYHMRHEKFDESLAYNSAADALSASEEESELVLRNRIEIFQTNRKLDEEVDRLRSEVESASEPTADAWHTLARYSEASRDWADATEALEKALAINGNSIPVLTSSARVAEASGDYGRAAAENRKLANIDRRLRSEHLMNVARLEAQLGNRDAALAAAKELIVAAPGNTDNYQFYSQLCYRLGETEMALNALRKAVRINPTEASLTIALGRALAEEFRTDEAIEVYWRAFEKTEELDDQTSLVQKLTSLYGQQNQFDKLLERLERDRREESKKREMTICIAQAHDSSGDYGTARRELESLLTDSTRDTNLLQQLSKLCESGSDLDAAVEYQTQLAKIAPGHESEFRLAKLLFSNGQRDAASEIFVKLTAREEDPIRLLKSIDSLLQRSNFDSVVKITEPLLRESRDNWELLYREGVALAKKENIDEAKIRFERILSLNFPHDKMGVVAEQKFKRASQKSKSNNNQGIRSKIPQRQSTFQLARSQSRSVKQAVGLTREAYYSGNQLPRLWTPSHFGIARMAAYGWLTRFESDANLEKDVAADATDDDGESDAEEATSFTDAIVERGKREDADPNEVYDWLYVENLRNDYKEIFNISRTLAIQGGKPEQEFFLASLPLRGMDIDSVQEGQQESVPDPDPLSKDDIELMLKCFEATSEDDDSFGSTIGSGQVLVSGGQLYVRSGSNSWRSISQAKGSLAQVAKELKLVGKTELAEKMVSKKIAAAKKPGQLVQAMRMMISDKKLDRMDEFLAKWKEAAVEEIELAPLKVSRRRKSANKASSNQTAGVLSVIRKWTGPLAAEEENEKVLGVINDVLDVEMKERLKKRKQAKASRRKRRSRNQYYNDRIPYQYGDKENYSRVAYPRAGDYLSQSGIHLLRQTYEVLKKNEVEEDLATLIRGRVKKAQSESPETLLYEQMLMATLLYWQDEKEEAVETFRAVSEQLSDDPQFQFDIASLYEQLGDHDEALNIIEAIEPREQKLVQQKETKVLALAERLGDLDRARAAAERLFGLRLKAETQLSLVGNMKRLGMVEMADAIVSRAQRRGGQKIPAMASLMGLYQSQGKTDLATQVAHRILQRTRSSVSQAALTNRNRNYGRSSGSNESHRKAAISTLQQAGTLVSVIERLEKQQQRSPDSPAIYEQLIEFYLQTNNSEKLIPILETAVEARPKSSYFREQLAKQYSAKGKTDEACEQYSAAIRENPSILSQDYHEIKNFFKEADRSMDLLKIFQEINIREFGQPYYVANFASELLRQSYEANTETMSEEEKKANEATELAAIKLAEKIFEEYPNYRRYVIQNFRGEKVWKNKRLFNLARKSIIPTKTQAKSDPWHGLNDISSRSGDGTVSSMFHDIFKGIEGTDQEKELCSSIEQNIVKKPEWLAGKIMLAMFDVRDDREEKAKKSLIEIFANEKITDAVSGDTARLVAQELEKFSETREIAIKLLEKAAKNSDSRQSSSVRYTATGKLITLYIDAGETETARKLLMDASKQETHQNYDRQYQLYQRGQSTVWIAKKLVEIDYSADAVSMMQGMLNDTSMLDAWQNYGGNRLSEAKKIYSEALDKVLSEGDTASVAKTIIAVRDNPRAGDGVLDLQVGMRAASNNREPQNFTPVNGRRVAANDDPSESDSQIQCKTFGLLEALSQEDTGKQILEERLNELQVADPSDKTLAIANVWFQLIRSPENAVTASESLLKLVAEYPLDEIREGRRPNSRQRREGMQHVALWPVSYRFLSSENKRLREIGAEFGELAIEGARLQSDKQYQHRILFEWATLAAEDNNLTEAEQKWSQLLDEVTHRPTRKKKPQPANGEPSNSTRPTRRKAQGTGMLDWRRLRAVQSALSERSRALVPSAFQVAMSSHPAATFAILQAPAGEPIQESPQAKTETKPKVLIAPLTNSQFQIALQVAIAAAENDMTELSKRAVRELLKGGLPVADPKFEDSNNNYRSGIVYTSSSRRSSNSKGGDATSPSGFGSQIIEILKIWKKKKSYEPVEVYDMVVGELFPDNRPKEIVLYENSKSISDARVSSLAHTVVSWAAKADRLDDLKKRIATRESYPTAEVQAMVLRGMIALEEDNFTVAKENLVKLVNHITNQPVPRNVDLACHVAVPSWLADKSLRGPCIEIYRKKIATDKNPSLGKLTSRVNQHLAANGGDKEIGNFFEGYLTSQQAKYSNYGGDYGVYQMQQSLYKISNDLAKSNSSDLALEYIGRGQDIKHSRNYGSNSVDEGWIETAKRIRALPAKERYSKLKEWTLPKPDRQTVRFVSAWKTGARDELADFRVPEVRDLPESSLPGLHCNFLDLIDAAMDAGMIDDLKTAAAAVDIKKYPAIEGLQIGVAIRSDDPAAKDLVKKHLEQSDDRKKNKRLKDQTNRWLEHLIYRLCLETSQDLAQLYDDHHSKFIKNSIAGTNKVTRRAYETLKSKALGASIEPGTSAPLIHWTSQQHGPQSNGKVNSWSVSDNNQLTTLGGDTSPRHWLKYPLAGDFEFSCEAYGPGAEVSFGSAMAFIESNHGSKFATVKSIGGHDEITRRTKASVNYQRYNQLTIEVKNGVMRKLLNGKLLYEEKLTGSYPWLMVFSNSSELAAWRNPVFSGQPEIPNAIELIVGDRMEGWATGKESQIAFRRMAEPKLKLPSAKEDPDEKKNPEDYDWHAKEGVLYGKANEDAKEGSDSLVSYRRPMSEGERLTFEFRYEVGKKMTNPTIGSVVVGLTDGDRIQELYAGDSELKEFATIVNVVDSPHAVEPVKLIPDAWNAVELKIVDANAEVVVNDAIVWRRPLNKLDNLYPGIQKFKTHAAEIRNLRLQGDWQKTLPAGLNEDALASSQTLQENDRNLIAEAIGDRFQRVEMLALYEEPASDDDKLSDLQCYEQFRSWVFPGYGHGIRTMYGMPTSKQRAAAPDKEINCPAWDMIALAEKAGKLDELTQSIDQIELPEDKSSDKFRDAMALKTLLAIANEDDQTARSHLGEIYASVVAVEKKAKENKVDPFSNHSPNFNQRSEINRTSIAVPTWYATNRPALLDCATSLHTKCKWGLKNRILARIENRSFTSTNETKSLTQWHSMPRSTQSGNQSERYLDRWQMTSTGLLEHLPGVTNTPLYFQSPLQGKFEITADVTLQTGTQCWLDYGGYAIIPQEKHHQTRIADGSNSSVEEKKKVPRLHSVAQYRIVVDGNDIEIYVNDVRVSRHEFDEAPQPWFSLEANNSDARPILQNIRITGQPEIPQEIDLLAADRPQWRGSFERFKKDSQNQSRHYSHRTRAQMQQQILNANAKWVLKKGELTSGSLTEESSEAPIFEESWLLYRRPMLEDGEFEFEMLADEKEKKLCHVALGRTAMLLKEDGIWRHKIYGGEDLEEEVADERIAGSKGVKLKNGDWNRVLIRLTGDEATLAVNDQEVAVLPITEIASQRFPGLFRFSDQSNAQVRNIKYRGKWPISLPTLEQQELALTSADPLAGVVVGQSKTYDLSQSIDQLNTAGLEVKGETQIETTADGMKITARKNADSANWPTVSATVDSAKDFDVSVSFADLKIANVTGWGCNLDLQVDFDDVEKSAITVGMRRDKDNALFVLAQREYDQPDGERGYHWVQLFKPLEQGTLRLVRHNGKIYALAAANGKPHQVINSFTVGQKAVSAISVIVKSATDTAEFDGVVKQVSLTLAD